MGARGATASWLLAARGGEGLTELCAIKEKSEIFGKRGNAGNVGTGGSDGTAVGGSAVNAVAVGAAAVGAAAVGGTAGAGVNGIGAVVMRGLKTDLKNGWVLSMNPRNGGSPGPRFQTQQGLRFRGWGWSAVYCRSTKDLFRGPPKKWKLFKRAN